MLASQSKLRRKSTVAKWQRPSVNCKRNVCHQSLTICNLFLKQLQKSFNFQMNICTFYVLNWGNCTQATLFLSQVNIFCCYQSNNSSSFSLSHSHLPFCLLSIRFYWHISKHKYTSTRKHLRRDNFSIYLMTALCHCINFLSNLIKVGLRI